MISALLSALEPALPKGQIGCEGKCIFGTPRCDGVVWGSDCGKNWRVHAPLPTKTSRFGDPVVWNISLFAEGGSQGFVIRYMCFVSLFYDFRRDGPVACQSITDGL
jgi:hypothetical protein